MGKGHSKKEEDKKKHKEEIDNLQEKVLLLENEVENLRKTHSEELLSFINKKSKEASEIIASKEKELIDKYEQEYDEKLNYKYFAPLKELAEVISQFESVIIGIKNPEVSNYLVGFKMFLSQFENILNSFEIDSFLPSAGDEYNSETMEAISTKETSDEASNGLVAEVFRKGYKLKNRILKLSTVSVFKFSEK